MKLKLLSIEHEVGNIYSFYFEPQESVVWLAGQYLNLTMPDVTPVNADRLFTIASAPHEHHIQITTFIGPSAFKQKLMSLDYGTVIDADQVGGDFYWEDSIPGAKSESTKVSDKKLYLAGGLGITPFRSIIVDRDYKRLPQSTVLMWSGIKDQCPFDEELTEIAARSSVMSIHRYKGVRITPQRVVETISDLDERLIYLAGSQNFVESIGDGLMKLGIPRSQLKYDWFDGYAGDLV